MIIRRIARANAYRLITDWLAAPKMKYGRGNCRGKTGAVSRAVVARGQWIIKEADGCWGALDNHDGILAVREFSTQAAAEKWLEKNRLKDLIRLRRLKNEKQN